MSTPTLKTAAGHEFRSTGDACAHCWLLTTPTSLPALDAMQTVPDLLSTIQDPIVGAGIGEALVGNTAWLVSHTLESAKAVVDSLIEDPKRTTE